MKIYVDEIPKNCKECPLYRSGKLKIQKGGRYIDADTCVLGNYYKFQEIDDEIDTCQLMSAQSLKQQVREEAVEEIRKAIGKKSIHMYTDNAFTQYKEYGSQLAISWYDVNKILDQVKGENNED